MTVELARAPYALARALAATVLVMAGAVVAHTWAGGHLPGAPGMLALAGLVWGLSLLVLRGQVSSTVMLPVVAVAQAGLHGLFATLAPADAHAAHAGHAGGLVDASGAALGGGWQMLLAHAVGTLLTALAWWLCDRAVVAVVTVLALTTAYAGGRRDPRAAERPRLRPSLAPLVVAPHRGPPVAA